MTTATRYARMVGYLAVRKNTVGDVHLTTSPAITLVDNTTKVVATGLLEVDHALKTSNIEKLLALNIISLVM